MSHLKTLLALCDQKESLPGDTIYKYARRAQAIAIALHDQPLLRLSRYYILLSMASNGQLDSVLTEDDLTLKNLHFEAERDLYVKYSLQRARVLIKSARYREAQTAIFNLLDQAGKNHDATATIYGLTYIGWTYMEMEQLPAALEWLYKAQNELETSKLDLDYSPLYSNIAATLDDMGHHDSAMIYVQKAITSGERGQHLSYIANGLAIQSDIFVHMNQADKAEQSMNRALAIRRQIGDPFYIISDMGALAYLCSIDHKTAEGIRLCREGIALARQYRFLPKQLYLSNVLAQNYKAAGDFKSLSETQAEIIALKDSLYRNNSNQSLADMQARYETQKKENTIIDQKYKLTRTNYLIVGITSLFLLTLALGVIVFEIRRHRQTRRMRDFELDSQRRRQQAIDQTREEERKRILADLHDELGSGLSTIRIMSDLVASHTPGPQEINRYATRISDISRNTAQGMNTIIWALNNDNDTLQNLCEYIARFGEDLFENTGTGFHLVTPPADLPSLQLSGAHRKNLFLCVKESLHNILKHAGARNAWVNCTIQNDDTLVISVTDDGRGLPSHQSNRFGNGLKNIDRRMHEIGGLAQLQSLPESGLEVRLELTFL